jgi:hypothetical protein
MLCLAAAGLVVSLPVVDFTLAWEHTIERIEWQEDYRLTPEGLVLTEARIQPGWSRAKARSWKAAGGAGAPTGRRSPSWSWLARESGSGGSAGRARGVARLIL